MYLLYATKDGLGKHLFRSGLASVMTFQCFLIVCEIDGRHGWNVIIMGSLLPITDGATGLFFIYMHQCHVFSPAQDRPPVSLLENYTETSVSGMRFIKDVLDLLNLRVPGSKHGIQLPASRVES